MKLGTMVYMAEDIGSGEAFRQLKELGFDTCQLVCWEEHRFTDAFADTVNRLTREFGITITAFWCGYGPPTRFDFYEGPITVGLVPAPYRLARMETLIKAGTFAHKIGVTDVVTHAGFIPENPNDPDYAGTISALKEIARRYQPTGQYLLFETGQETPITLLRTIQDMGMENVGVNLDPANLILYGKANPVDALDTIGKWVRGVHAKDGNYPTDGRYLGEETALGKGRVDFPRFIAKLKALGYDGAITIEREISGEEQIKDILDAKAVLEKLLEA